jgi:DNA-binding Lrp family transcriptional regulator
MADSSTLDDLDRRLLHALQVDGRVSFNRVAEVIGVSGQTVARRYARLRSQGALRVVGLTDPRRLGHVMWLTRVKCTPDAVTSIAEALARRPDTSWVQLTSGGTDISCMIRSTESPDGEALLRQLPRTPRVLDVTAHCVLHVFASGAHCLLDKIGFLSGDQIARLRPRRKAAEHLTLTDSDRRLLAALHQDGRTPLADLAAATRSSPSTVRRSIAALQGAGVLHFEVDFDPALLGLRFRALLWLSVAPAHLHEVGEQFATHPEAAYVAATTGSTNLVTSVVCSSVPDLYRYITERVAVLPAVTHLETAPVVRAVKSAASIGRSPVLNVRQAPRTAR